MTELRPSETAFSIVPVLACVLNQLCERNNALGTNSRSVNKFYASCPPSISIREYLERIAKYSCCSGECFVLALVYIDQIIKSNPAFVVNSLNIHRLLITSVMLAAKFFDDHYYNNAYFAKVGGVPIQEINSLEVEFLFMTNFDLFVPTDTYAQYYGELVNHTLDPQCQCIAQKGRIPPLVLPYAPTAYASSDDEDEADEAEEEGDEAEEEAEKTESEEEEEAGELREGEANRGMSISKLTRDSRCMSLSDDFDQHPQPDTSSALFSAPNTDNFHQPVPVATQSTQNLNTPNCNRLKRSDAHAFQMGLGGLNNPGLSVSPPRRLSTDSGSPPVCVH